MDRLSKKNNWNKNGIKKVKWIVPGGETGQDSIYNGLKVLHDNGVNYIRIRIWNDPTNEKGETYGGGANDVATGLEIAKEAAQYDMKLLLDFHYSDFWADPALQKIPKAWEKDKNDTEKMKQNVYDFTKDTIKKFQEVGADIGMVQVGNEITNGMLDIMPDIQREKLIKIHGAMQRTPRFYVDI